MTENTDKSAAAEGYIPYSEQLKDQRWYDKRAIIIDRDRGMCLRCGTNERLQVHHFYYVSKRKAWEYPDDALMTLCVSCHEWMTNEGISNHTFYSWEKAACAVLHGMGAILRRQH